MDACPEDVGALRAALIATTRSLESNAVILEQAGQRNRARWMREDAALGEAALESGAALLRLLHAREEEHRRAA